MQNDTRRAVLLKAGMKPCSRCGRARYFVPAPGQLETEQNVGPWDANQPMPSWAKKGSRLSAPDNDGTRYILWPVGEDFTEKDRWSARSPLVVHSGECAKCYKEGQRAAGLWNAMIESGGSIYPARGCTEEAR